MTTVFRRPSSPAPGHFAGLFRTVLLAAAVAAALPSAVSAATVAFRIDRTSADPEERTLSGSGFLEFDGPASDPADISVLSVRVETLGTVHPEDEASFPTTHVFIFDRTNVTAVSGLALAGTGLTGSIDFDGVLSEGAGLVFMDDFSSTRRRLLLRQQRHPRRMHRRRRIEQQRGGDPCARPDPAARSVAASRARLGLPPPDNTRWRRPPSSPSQGNLRDRRVRAC